MRPGSSSPIGIFDSGVGGLTVVRELTRRLPQEGLVYFGDTARVPYGPKSAKIVRRYAAEAASFLLSRGVKMVVVACNTVSAHALDMLVAELPVPVVGVVLPGARAAVRETRSGRIGVIGTAGTITSGVYDLEVRRLLPSARVYAQPCPLLVPLVEEGWLEHEVARLTVEEYLRPLREVDVDVLVLGCTHYPLLRPLVAEIMGPGVHLIDSGAEAAADVQRILGAAALLRQDPAPPTHTFVVSDSPLRFREVRERFVEGLIGPIERFDVEGYGRAA